jgi:hypothetical protein
MVPPSTASAIAIATMLNGFLHHGRTIESSASPSDATMFGFGMSTSVCRASTARRL